MRFRFIEISNYLSYGPSRQHIEFDTGLTVLVGPNGGGKTNIIRALDTVRDVITGTVSRVSDLPIVTPKLLEQQSEAHFAHLDKPIEIVLGVKFSDKTETEEIASFIYASILSSLDGSWRGDNAPSEEDKQSLVTRALEMNIPDWFTSGNIRLYHGVRSSDQWELSYVTGPNEKMLFEFLLSGSPPSRMSTFGKSISPQANRSTIGEKFRQSDPVKFDDLMPKKGELIEILIHNDSLNNIIRSFPSIAYFARRLENYSWSPMVRVPQNPAGFHHVLDSLFQARVFSDSEDAPLGKPINVTTESISTANSPIFRAGNVRIPRYLEQLYRWQNSFSGDRARFAEAQEIFTSFRKDESFGLLLSPGKPVALNVWSASNATNQTLSETANQALPPENFPRLIPFVERHGTKTDMGNKQSREVSADQAGSGVAELIRLSTFLASDPESVVLLDEPMARLHPMLQKQFVRQLQEAKSQYIVVSHAPGLFPTKTSGDDHSNLVKRVALDKDLESRVYSLPFFSTDTVRKKDNDKTGKSLVLKKYTENLKEKIIKEMQTNSSVLEIPFAERLVLVSGESELIAYQAWCLSYWQNKHTTYLPHFHSFGGDDHFDVLLAIAMAFHVPWLAILDGGSFEPCGKIGGFSEKVPLVLGQIATASTWACREDWIDKIKEKAEEVKYTNGCDNIKWMENAKSCLESLGVYTFANCWNTSKKAETCDTCKKTVDPNATAENTLPDYHQESFEDLPSNYFSDITNHEEYTDINKNTKVSRARKLVELQPKYPDCLDKIFSNIDNPDI